MRPSAASPFSFTHPGGGAGHPAQAWGPQWGARRAWGVDVRWSQPSPDSAGPSREFPSGAGAAHAIAGPSVVADTGPSFGSASLSDQSDVSGPAINRLALPAATGGDSPLAYSLRPAAPGRPFNSQARQLSGTPTSPGTSSMRFSVRDSDGDAATLRFASDTEPGAGTTGASRYSMGDRITTLPAGRWTPDVASGGSFQHSGGTAAVRLNRGGCIEEGDCRYTCASSGGARRSTAR